MKLFICFISLISSFLSCTDVTERNKSVLTDSISEQTKRKEKDTIPIIETDKNNINRVLYDSVYSHVSYLEKKYFTINTSIVYKQNKFIIKSEFMKDSVSVEESNMFNPIPIKQEIYFYDNDELKSTVIYPAKKIIQKTENGESVEMLDNVLMSAGIIKGKKDDLFIIGGYGGCNDCSELEGYYTLEGKLLGINYRTKSAVYISTADINKIISIYQLDEKELFEKKYSWIRIY